MKLMQRNLNKEDYMEPREKTLADIFLDILSQSRDERTKTIAERLKAITKVPEIAELINICVINAIGCRFPIKEYVVDESIKGITDLVHADIDIRNLPKDKKGQEKESYKYFMETVGLAIKRELQKSNQLEQ